MEYNLTRQEAVDIRVLASELRLKFRTVDNAEFHEVSHQHRFHLPVSLMSEVSRLKTKDVSFGRVNGLIVHDNLLKQTPASWRDDRSDEAYICEFMHYLISSHIGQPFSWKTQQSGRTVNDILPVKGFEQEQLAIASKSHLMWRVEDAFHDARGEFLSLMCLRNNDNVPTLISAPDMSQLSRAILCELFKPQFLVRADDAHDPNMNLTDASSDHQLQEAFGSASHLRRVAILFGHPDRPYLRLDMDTFGREDFISPEAKAAYDKLCALVDSSAKKEFCKAGDILIVNNFLTVHGRPPFEPHYDGTDRWLQWLLVNSDFRKTAPYRETSDSNVLFA